MNKTIIINDKKFIKQQNLSKNETFKQNSLIYQLLFLHIACENIHFSSLFAVNVPRDEDRGETDVFAGYLTYKSTVLSCPKRMRTTKILVIPVRSYPPRRWYVCFTAFYMLQTFNKNCRQTKINTGFPMPNSQCTKQPFLNQLHKEVVVLRWPRRVTHAN